VIPDGGRLRIGMTNPPYILEHLEVSIADSDDIGDVADNSGDDCVCCDNDDDDDDYGADEDDDDDDVTNYILL